MFLQLLQQTVGNRKTRACTKKQTDKATGNAYTYIEHFFHPFFQSSIRYKSRLSWVSRVRASSSVLLNTRSYRTLHRPSGWQQSNTPGGIWNSVSCSRALQNSFVNRHFFSTAEYIILSKTFLHKTQRRGLTGSERGVTWLTCDSGPCSRARFTSSHQAGRLGLTRTTVSGELLLDTNPKLIHKVTMLSKH